MKCLESMHDQCKGEGFVYNKVLNMANTYCYIVSDFEVFDKI